MTMRELLVESGRATSEELGRHPMLDEPMIEAAPGRWILVTEYLTNQRLRCLLAQARAKLNPPQPIPY